MNALFSAAEKIRALKAGDEVLLSGVGFTGRAAVGLPASAIGVKLPA
jgi:tartrate dehydratase beta subunit/fumarate hydratase class I family protein